MIIKQHIRWKLTFDLVFLLWKWKNPGAWTDSNNQLAVHISLITPKSRQHTFFKQCSIQYFVYWLIRGPSVGVGRHVFVFMYNKINPVPQDGHRVAPSLMCFLYYVSSKLVWCSVHVLANVLKLFLYYTVVCLSFFLFVNLNTFSFLVLWFNFSMWSYPLADPQLKPSKYWFLMH